jgi:hypothetical protein
MAISVLSTAVGASLSGSVAHAQGDPVGGPGAEYLLAGAGNTTGQATARYYFGNPTDVVYFGDFLDASGAFGSDGRDEPMVRRGNTFIIRGAEQRPFTYGDPGDTVLVGDWDGDGTDTLAVRRGNTYFVKNTLASGAADATFAYGDAGDRVLVGRWTPGQVGDSLAVRRGNTFYLAYSTGSATADVVFAYGDATDTAFVGDWDGDGVDGIGVRRP